MTMYFYSHLTKKMVSTQMNDLVIAVSNLDVLHQKKLNITSEIQTGMRNKSKLRARGSLEEQNWEAEANDRLPKIL